jgi:outer membrane biosynthesis protein TonB
MKKCPLWYTAIGCVVVAACAGTQPEAAPPETPKAEPAEPVAAASSAPAAPAAEPAPAEPSPAAEAPHDRDINDIQAVVSSHRQLFRDCYERSLRAHPGIKGKYVLKFVIKPDGTVQSAETDQATSQIHQSDMAACAEAAVRTLKFPPNKKGKESKTSYPFEFYPKP